MGREKTMVLRVVLCVLCFLLVGSSAATPSSSERAIGAIEGMFVADAATMPLHWIYSTKSIASKLQGSNPEFFHTPSCPFYSYKLGQQTPYGQQTSILLQTMAANSTSAFDPVAYEANYHRFYAPGGACYTNLLNGTMLHDLCYHDGSTKGFMQNVDTQHLHWPQCGANDTQANAIAHMPVVVARYKGLPEMLDRVADAIRVTQNTDEAVAFGLAGARILENVIIGPEGQSGLAAVRAAVDDMKQPHRKHPMPQDADLASRIDKVLTQLDRSNFDVVMEVGQACDYPNNLISGAHLIAQVTGDSLFVNGTRQTIIAGGDSGSRNMFVGAVLGALQPAG